MQAIRFPVCVLIAASLLSACGPILFVEVEVPRVCKTLPNQSMPAVAMGQLEMDVPFDFEVPPGIVQMMELGVDADLRLSSAAFASQTSDLSFLHELRLSISAPGSSLTPMDVLNYTKPTGATNLSRVDLVDAGGGKNVVPYIESGRLHIEAHVKGELPGQAWSTDVTACLYGKILVDYGSIAMAQLQ